MLKSSFFYSTTRLISALICAMLFTLSGIVVAQTTNTSKPQLVPNARRYKDTGMKPATGRSGSASLAARALLGKDGTTTIEMSTGQLDTDAATPGSINKAQL